MGRREFTHDEVKVSARVMPITQLLIDQLSLNGGSTAFALNVDASTAQQSFQYIVPAGKQLLLHELQFEITDAAVDPGGFGGIVALTTGCGLDILTSTGGVVKDLTPAGRKLKMNTDFLHFGGSLDIQTGATEDLVSARYDLSEVHGFIVVLSSGQAVEMTLDDDLSALSSFEVVLAGRLLPA